MTDAGDLVTIMYFDPNEGIRDLDRLINALRDGLVARGGSLDRHAARNELHAATFRRTRASRVLMRVSISGAIAIEVRDWRQDDVLPEHNGRL